MVTAYARRTMKGTNVNLAKEVFPGASLLRKLKSKEENKEDRRGMEACFEVIKVIEKIVEDAGITWKCPPKTDDDDDDDDDDDEFKAKFEALWGQGQDLRNW